MTTMAVEDSPDVGEEIDIAYLAGLFDGLGKIKLASLGSGVPRRLYVALNLVSTPESEALLLDLKLAWGGKVHRSGDRRTWKWQLQANGAADFLEDLLPQLTLKREQADVAAKWQRNGPHHAREAADAQVLRGGDDETAEELRDIKRRGLRNE